MITATGLFSDGDLVAAENIIRAFLLAHGDHIEAMRLLARIGVALEVFDDAEVLLEAVLERVPDYVAARHDYASVLLGRHKHGKPWPSSTSCLRSIRPIANTGRCTQLPPWVSATMPARSRSIRSCCATRRRDRPAPNCIYRSRIR